jgi:hypothetical protein
MIAHGVGQAIVLLLILSLVIGFAGGYGVRELISRRRRAGAREEFFRRQEKKKLQRGLIAYQSVESLDQSQESEVTRRHSRC